MATPKKKPAKPAKAKKPAANKKRYCIHPGCKDDAVSKGYCRLHYIANWKRIRLGHQIKAEKRLNAYVNHLVKKYPADFLDRIKEGLENEDTFKKTVEELDLDESEESEREFAERLARNLKITE